MFFDAAFGISDSQQATDKKAGIMWIWMYCACWNFHETKTFDERLLVGTGKLDVSCNFCVNFGNRLVKVLFIYEYYVYRERFYF